jgi:tripartite-type tricarboxylate transporter receptor subunit TctC
MKRLVAACAAGILAALIAGAALASEASGQRGNFIMRAPDTRPEPGSSARAALASEASGQRGNFIMRAPDTRPEPGSSARAFAQASFPTRAVRFIVPFPGGGINDILARIIGEKLQARWGQPIVIENKTGAGGNIGAELAYQSEPDGYTLLLAPPGPLAINQTLYKQLSYKPQDFVPITLVGSVPNVAIVRKELPVNSLKELIDYVKANPGKVTFGSQGNGATPHLTGMMFQGLTGTHMVHVPYRGETLVLQDMIGGHVDVFFGNVAAARPQFRDGKVKVVAVLDSKRAPTLPEIPTTAEAGLPGLVSTGWFALAAPPKASPALQAEIAKTVAEVISMPDVQARFRAASVEPTPSTPAEMAAFIREETRRWGDVIKKNNIVVD